MTQHARAHAVVILREYADAIRQGCMSGEREWACPDCKRPCADEARYVEIVHVADALDPPPSRATPFDEMNA